MLVVMALSTLRREWTRTGPVLWPVGARFGLMTHEYEFMKYTDHHP